MKIYFCIVATLSAFALVRCDYLPELYRQIDECFQEFKVNQEVLITPNYDDIKLHCAAACILKKGNRLTGGKLSHDKEINYSARNLSNETAFTEKITDCVNIANAENDECALGGAYYKCLHQKYGLWSF